VVVSFMSASEVVLFGDIGQVKKGEGGWISTAELKMKEGIFAPIEERSDTAGGHGWAKLEDKWKRSYAAPWCRNHTLFKFRRSPSRGVERKDCGNNGVRGRGHAEMDLLQTKGCRRPFDRRSRRNGGHRGKWDLKAQAGEGGNPGASPYKEPLLTPSKSGET